MTMIDEKALYVAATAALNARRAANGWPATTLDKMLTPDRDAWIADVRAAILSYEAAKPVAEPVAIDNAARAIALVDGINLDWIEDQNNPRWRRYRQLAEASLSAPASKDGG